MEIAPRGRLPRLIGNFLRERGFDDDALRIPQLFIHPWTRPPFFTEASLAGEPLQPHIAFDCGVDLDDFVDVYERYITLWLRSKKLWKGLAHRWLQRELGLHHSVQRLVFAQPEKPAKRLAHSYHVAQLGALAAYKWGATVTNTADTLLADTGTYRFGIDRGNVVSNLPDAPPMLPLKRLTGGKRELHTLLREGKYYPQKPSMFDRVRFWAKQTLKGTPEAESLDLALRVLYWRGTSCRYESIQMLLLPAYSKLALRLALKSAREYPNLVYPWRCLYEIFVPQFMGPRQFLAHFPADKALRVLENVEWDAALSLLEPQDDNPEEEK